MLPKFSCLNALNYKFLCQINHIVNAIISFNVEIRDTEKISCQCFQNKLSSVIATSTFQHLLFCTLKNEYVFKAIFYLANFFARREAKTRIQQRDWLTLVGEKTCREQVGTVPTFLPVHANKFAKWKTGLR